MDPISIIGGLGNDYMMKHTGKSIEMDLFEIFFSMGSMGNSMHIWVNIVLC